MNSFGGGTPEPDGGPLADTGPDVASEAADGSPSTGDVLTGVTAISSGLHSCVVLTGGTAACWGYDADGELGDGMTAMSLVPVPVSGLTGVAGISAAVESNTSDGSGAILHTCAVLKDGSVSCWGGNLFGQLGNGSTKNSLLPVAVSGLAGAIMVSAGTFHTCALMADGTVKCWGDNGNGELGDGSTSDSPVPVAAIGVTGATAIAAGNAGQNAYTCALLAEGNVKCWGYNGDGELGNGSTTDSLTPVAVYGLTGAVSISAHNGHTCAALGSGTVQCWGGNVNGELGNASTSTSISVVPVTVDGIGDATAASTGGGDSCALLMDGTVQCWGGGSPSPVAVSGLTHVAAISTGSGGNCALLIDGTVQCWGSNSFGQLGNGTTTSSAAPMAVSAPH